ncbi:two-component response regulator ORR27-like [Lolium rigidum]|uniref:two-component response regulator ORR27-like n=1 Tax=Lolium rigidum TaxID=89674 RepID=UPI001F5DCFDB|nr:two-component response regulator ORR27-like [Lolium rigidum]
MENNAALAAGAGMAASPEAELARTCRVLVVEEDPSYRATLTQMIQSRGYPVTAKASLEEGLRALRDNPEGFDLVMAVADTQGPGIDGFELLKHTKENYPVILFSDCASKEKVIRALVEGACDFLEKPMLDSEISRIWQHVLRRNANIDFGPTDDSDEGDSGGSQQHKQGRTNFNSSPGQHALLVKAPQQLSGTEAMETAEQKEGPGVHVPTAHQDKIIGGST